MKFSELKINDYFFWNGTEYIKVCTTAAKDNDGRYVSFQLDTKVKKNGGVGMVSNSAFSYSNR